MRRFAGVMMLVTALLGAAVSAPQRVDAALLEYQVGDIPWPGGAVPELGLALFDANGFARIFNWVNGTFQVDSVSGNAKVFGDMMLLDNGEIWHVSANFEGSAIHSTGAFASGPVPYDTMFDDLKNAGVNATNKIIWGSAPPGLTTAQGTLELTTDVVNPFFTGPKSYISKADLDGNPFFVKFRPSFLVSDLPGSEWDLLGAQGWWSPVGSQGAHGGDIWFVMRPPTPPVIPEPGSIALFGMGLCTLVGSVRGRFSRRQRS